LVFEKNANFFAENCRKSEKIVIITSTPGWPDWANFHLLGDCLHALGSCLKVLEVAQILWLFYHSKNYVLIYKCVICLHVCTTNMYWTKMGWTTFWAIFFTNSSGQPAFNPISTKKLYFLHYCTLSWFH
jgi:hypothetical protein